jgi:hypothetical protein
LAEKTLKLKTNFQSLNMASFNVQNEPTANSSTDFFATAYANGPSKVASILISLISILLIVTSGTGIIWFERFGSDQKRTLIIRLLTSVCVTGIEFYLIPLPFEIVRHLYGPFNNATCSFMLIFKTSLSIQVGLFTLGFSVSRYLYIFHLKNPARFQDAFWHFFVNIWVVSFGIISQFVFVILPGRQPISFYLCNAKILEHLEMISTKRRTIYLMPLFLSALLFTLQLPFRLFFTESRLNGMLLMLTLTVLGKK